MTSQTVTRGGGLLERWLASKRAAMADRLIPETARGGAILDLGCGSWPLFLSQTRFGRRVGVDRDAARLAERFADLELVSHDLHDPTPLPFDDATFDVVTMLAVFEHLAQPRLAPLLDEAHRLLKPDGRLILTTPAAWTKAILWTLARLGLVSRQEIDEHEDHYSRAAIRAVLSRTRFAEENLRFGAFELGMNTWAVASRGPG